MVSLENDASYLTTVAVLGNVDSGKSTLIGDFKSGVLDNGAGKARASALLHRHEREAGRTSACNVFIVGVDGALLRMVDLSGHRSYLGATVRGVTRYHPDYAVLLVEAGSEDVRSNPMTSEHLRLCVSLGVPFAVVVTKTDAAAPELLKKTLRSAVRELKIKGFRFPNVIRDDAALERFLGSYTLSVSRHFVPILPTSAVTGDRLVEKERLQTLFVVYCPYQKDGFGLILYGICRAGEIGVGEKLLLGPFDGAAAGGARCACARCTTCAASPFRGCETSEVGCLCIKDCDGRSKRAVPSKSQITGGMVCTEPRTRLPLARGLEARISLGMACLTIREGYSAVLHADAVSST